MEKPNIRILLADDDEMDRLLFIEVFEELKIITMVVTVNNGAQLMKYLNENPDDLPQIVFLDLNMPRKNGLDCLKEIRKNNLFNDISVAIYSTSKSEKDIEDTFHNGANIYITKPGDYNELKKVLEIAVMTSHLYKDKVFDRANFLLKI